ncbi:MAG: sulfite exporter TauE/SafE family protein, partial [Candidatus Hadarchaeales archaeon]
VEMLLLPIGFLIAVLYSMIGLGGGSIFVPLLVLAFGLQTQKAIGTSLFAITFMTIAATMGYAAQKRINYKVGLLLDTLDVPGAALGAYFTTLVASSILGGMFGAVLLVIAGLLFFQKKSERRATKFAVTHKVIGSCLLGSLLSGVVSGMFGIGGGVVDETVMIFLLGMSIHTSAGTAMFGMAITTVAALLPHWFLGNVLPDYAVPLAIGCMLGAPVGSFFSAKIKAVILRRILGVVLVGIAFRMLLLPCL